ncbi:hypothetical protein [uncultured Roseovarius sp.]|uniref:hypothetical protein n=1 Tax=uncultured Roseovarius sp. TaxID=293344 RepID=UPI0026163A51|nr:hypothetical protein [uncultured Roseovarius sp.]
MKNYLILGLVATLLAGCGSSNSSKPRRTTHQAPMPFASGPLGDACIASDRTARSHRLCGCIQAVANQTLTGSEQRRAVLFYNNPQQAQDIRQSERYSDEQFWKAYRAYGERAERTCR